MARKPTTTELKQKWFEDNGFNSEGSTYIVFGTDVNSIADELKEIGYQYSSFFGWHSPKTLDVPINYNLVEVRYYEYMVWDSRTNKMIFKKNAKKNFLARFGN